MLYYVIQVNVSFFSGPFSDGDFRSFRMQGETRALHVWELTHDANVSIRKILQRIRLEGEMPRALQTVVLSGYSLKRDISIENKKDTEVINMR